jgi:hypothetical protein
MNKFIVLTVALVIVILSVVIIAIMVVRNVQKDDLTDENGDTNKVKTSTVLDEAGYLKEGESYLDDIEITQPDIICVNFSLHWVDEDANYDRYTNMPDNFSLEVEPPENSSFLCSPFNKVIDNTGHINISFRSNSSLNVEHSNSIGTWRFNVTCVDAGDQIKTSGLEGLMWKDSGNTWDLYVTVTYLVEKN